MNEGTYFDGEAIEESEFVGEFYDLEFEWPEVVETDEQ